MRSPLIPDLQALAAEARARAIDGGDFDYEYRRARDSIIRGLGVRFVGGARSKLAIVPYLDAAEVERCRYALEFARFVKNEDEDEPYQINECILSQHDHLQGLNDYLVQKYHEELVPLWVVLFGVAPSALQVLQAARFTPDSPRTQWHYDRDSECSSVVALENPPQGCGGGIQLYPEHAPFTWPGEAILFPGSTTLHRSIPVTEARRTILVHWANTKE